MAARKKKKSVKTVAKSPTATKRKLAAPSEKSKKVKLDWVSKKSKEEAMETDKPAPDKSTEMTAPVLVGAKTLPKRRGQIVVSKNPYQLEGNEIEELGNSKDLENMVDMSIRFDKNHGKLTNYFHSKPFFFEKCQKN